MTPPHLPVHVNHPRRRMALSNGPPTTQSWHHVFLRPANLSRPSRPSGGETTDSCASNREEPGASEAKGWCSAVIARTMAAAHQDGKLGVTEAPRSCSPGASRRPGLLPTRRFPPCSPQKLFTWLSTGSERLFTPVSNWPGAVNRYPRRCLAGECPRRHKTVGRRR